MSWVLLFTLFSLIRILQLSSVKSNWNSWDDSSGITFANSDQTNSQKKRIPDPKSDSLEHHIAVLTFGDCVELSRENGVDQHLLDKDRRKPSSFHIKLEASIDAQSQWNPGRPNWRQHERHWWCRNGYTLGRPHTMIQIIVMTVVQRQ